MSRIIKNGLLLSLLMCLPLLASAQLVRYEYWFDNNYAGRTPVTLNGSETTVDADIPTDGLDCGIHSLHFRVRRQDGWYSPVTSSLFFKAATGESGKIEYWFDNDFENRTTASLAAAGENSLTTMSLDLRDHDKFPMGAHRLHIRLLTDLGPTAIYTTDVLKLVLGKVEKLQYWFDDNFEDAKTTSGVDSQNGIVFAGDLDLSDVSEGMHRLYYRGLSENMQTSTAVSMAPVMVKSRYNTDGKDLKVVQYAVSVDGEEGIVRQAPYMSESMEFNYNLDARRLNDGEHKVKVRFWNTVGAGNSVEQAFTKSQSPTPAIELSATEKDGMVTLDYNSIPNDKFYYVWRKDNGGVPHRVATCDANYPSAQHRIDNPGNGDYTYYIRGYYERPDGLTVDIASNEVNVSINRSGTDAIQLGTVVGRINIDSNPVKLLPTDMSVTFSDGVTVKALSNGTFMRENLTVGTTLSMTVEDCPAYNFDSPSVTVTATTRNEVQIINATTRKDVAQQSSDAYNQLAIASEITGIPWGFNFTLKNTSGQPWSGNIKVIAAKKSYENSADKAVLFASFDSYHEVGSIHLNSLGGYASQPVKLEIQNFPQITSNEFYEFYIMSEADNAKGNYRILDCIVDKAKNPQVIEMAANSSGPLDLPDIELSDIEIDQRVLEIMKSLKKVKKYGGPFADALNDWAEMRGYFYGDCQVLASFSKDLKNAIKTVGDCANMVTSINGYIEEMKTITGWDNLDDFEKFKWIVNKSFKIMGPYAEIYKPYLTVVEKTKDAIDVISLNLTKRELAHRFEMGLLKFKIEVLKKNKTLGLFNSYYSGSEIYNQVNYVELHMITNQLGHVHRKYQCSADGDALELKWTGAPGTEIMENMDSICFWMKIKWANGRISIVPLLNRDLVSYDSSNMVITVRFKSEASTSYNMADILHLEPK